MLFGVLFGAYFLMLRKDAAPLSVLLIGAVVMRVAVWGNFPNLSDDMYRFVWDGRLWTQGENPFLHLPAYYMETDHGFSGLDSSLFALLNSPEYYSIYPPVCQWIFAVATFLFPTSLYGSALVMKGFILLAEIGNIWLIRKMAAHFKLPATTVLLYALNPLVIFELTGNAHFEAIMIFFLLGSIYALLKNNWLFSALLFALSVCTKLLPLMFLPFLIKRLGWVASMRYFAVVGLLVMLFFTPFISVDLVTNFAQSVDLYFQNFEFNASIYYVLRWIGIKITGFNLIKFVGSGLSGITLLFILYLAWREKNTDWTDWKNLPKKMLFAQTTYYGLATIVHPWYTTTLLALSSFTPYRYVAVWTATVTLSYYTYRDTTYTENLWLVAIEYLVVGGWMIYEFRKLKR